jgi:hypothetical protein
VQGDDVLVDVSSPVIAGGNDIPDPPLQAVASSLETQNTQES